MISTLIALPYQLARLPLVVIDRRLADRLPATSGPRVGLDLAIGSADKVAGALLRNDDIARRGAERLERGDKLVTVTRLEQEAETRREQARADRRGRPPGQRRAARGRPAACRLRSRRGRRRRGPRQAAGQGQGQEDGRHQEGRRRPASRHQHRRRRAAQEERRRRGRSQEAGRPAQSEGRARRRPRHQEVRCCRPRRRRAPRRPDRGQEAGPPAELRFQRAPGRALNLSRQCLFTDRTETHHVVDDPHHPRHHRARSLHLRTPARRSGRRDLSSGEA